MRGIIKTSAETTRLFCSNWLPKPLPSQFCQHNRVFTVQAVRPFETADMGKDKVSYQLKTPKGTKDCIIRLIKAMDFHFDQSY